MLSGKDGSLLHRFDASKRYQLFGYAVAGVGDLDQDGFPDLVVGVPGAGQVSDPAGRVYAYSGNSGQLLWSFTGSLPAGELGSDVNSAGDVDGDGIDDVIVGSRELLSAAGSGLAVVLSGATGTLLHILRSAEEGDAFGRAVAGLGDANRGLAVPLVRGTVTCGRNSCGASTNGWSALRSVPLT